MSYPTCYARPQMTLVDGCTTESKNMQKRYTETSRNTNSTVNVDAAGQLELSLLGRARPRRLTAREERLRRARWWFNKMRQVVDQALEWQPAPAARAEQIYFPQ